jgi:hypothetical protein
MVMTYTPHDEALEEAKRRHPTAAQVAREKVKELRLTLLQGGQDEEQEND